MLLPIIHDFNRGNKMGHIVNSEKEYRLLQ